ncbi:hypothetical protein DFQ28_005132 [Apophysomyces sp. BC1034]|nr:hypothetical protein DFQ29_004053 [Apophysomyces sp. BC1021]KAG0188296.1 hypothetical protein DFQ28_005132 [Apophysomyces sp. BC1034]
MLDREVSGNVLYGHQIRELYIHDPVRIMGTDLERLQCSCPFLEILDFQPTQLAECFPPPYADMLTAWQRLVHVPPIRSSHDTEPLLHAFGHRLTRLDIRSDALHSLYTHGRLVSTLCSLVCIRHLTLVAGYPIVLSLTDMECLHEWLPNLVYLDMQGIALEKGTLPTFQYISTTLRTFSLQLTSRNNSIQWLLYIAYKYPCLHTLVLDITSTSSPIFEQAYLLIASQLRRLHSLRIWDPQWPQTPFLRTLRECGTRLEVLETAATDDEDSDTSLAPLIQESYGFLSKLTLQRATHLPTTIPLLSHCQRLTKLELAALNQTYAIDVLLDQLVVLKSLDIEGIHFFVSESTFQQQHQQKNNISPKQHGLNILAMYESSFTSDIFYHLNLRCPDLSRLILQGCAVGVTAETTEFLIDMPSHRFTLIDIDGIRLVVDPETDWRHHYTIGTMTIFCLGQATGTEQWYHVCDEKQTPLDQEAFVPGLRKLEQQEIHTVKAYRPTRADWAACHHYERANFVHPKHWQLDIPLGYLGVRCQSVDTFKFWSIEIVE